MTEQELKKSIEDLVDKALEMENKEEVKNEEENVEKAKLNCPSSDHSQPGGKEADHPLHSEEVNGGKDSFKSGSPHSEQQEMMSKKKMKKSEDEEVSEEVETTEKAYEDKDEEKMEKKDYKSKMEKKDYKMKKSIEDLSEHLSEDELELVKAWRADQEEENKVEEVQSATEDFSKSLNSIVDEKLGELKKSIDEKDELIKGLTDEVKKLASQPAYDKRSISSLETIEKGGENTPEISKSQVLDTMLELQLAGKGVSSKHVTEFESTKNISDPKIKALVMNEIKSK